MLPDGAFAQTVVAVAEAKSAPAVSAEAKANISQLVAEAYRSIDKAVRSLARAISCRLPSSSRARARPLRRRSFARPSGQRPS